VQITLDAGTTPDRIEEAIVESLSREWRDQIESATTKRIEALIRERLDALTTEAVAKRLDEEIARMFAEGWPKTDPYGKVVGHWTIHDRIEETLKSRNEYDRESKFDKLVNARLAEAINKEFKPQIDAAAANLRKTLDATLNERFQKAMRESLGLK
jgi:uncharacterized protein (DUF2267 family)